MKAVVIREPGPPEQALRFETVPTSSPAAGEVVIEVVACGVCSHDVAKRAGTLRAGIKMPLIPGHEVSGRVAEVGANVTRFTVGDRIATTQRSDLCGQCGYCRTGREPLCDEAIFMGDAGLNGGYAQYVAVNAETIARVPDDVDLEHAAIAACAIGTMYHAISAIGNARPGERLLLTGATGGLGMHGVQLAKKAGAIVYAVTSSPAREADLRALGADFVIVCERGSDFSREVHELTGGTGVDIAVDTVGTPLFHPIRRSIAKGGRWVMVGQLTGDFVSFSPAQLFLKGISLLSATSTTRRELEICLDLMRPGGIRAVIDSALPLAKAAEAHRRVESGQARGRILLKP